MNASFARLLLTLAGTFLLSACNKAPADFFSGYAEADYVRLASPIGGTLSRLYLQRGDRVGAGAPAFALEQDSETAARAEAQARLARAEATLADLRKGRRPDELTVTEEQLVQARAALALSQEELARQLKLFDAKFVSASRIDQAREAARRDQARVRELQAQLRVAGLGARADALDAAAQDVAAARAQLAQADWKLSQKSLKAPLEAEVADVLYREGELVPAGAPVVSLLAPGHLRARFFVPEPQLGKIALGQDVQLSCDGCKNPIAAKISFIAHDAEYTAPLIYSKENRATLVFMVEARPTLDAARALHPGQPLEVRLGAAAK